MGCRKGRRSTLVATLRRTAKTQNAKRRGPPQAPTKVATTIRLSPEVVAAFKANGPGWQTKIDTALKDWLSTHSPA